jgi:hypothetical protein
VSNRTESYAKAVPLCQQGIEAPVQAMANSPTHQLGLSPEMGEISHLDWGWTTFLKMCC